jgi:hypothetical protein
MESWRKFHNEELYNMYSSPDIIRVIKSSKMKEYKMDEAGST